MAKINLIDNSLYDYTTAKAVKFLKMKKKQNKNIQFVILDCDNILVNTDTVLVSVMLDVLEEFGIDLPPDEAIFCFGGKSLQECITVLEKLCGPAFYKDYKTNLSHKLDTEIFQGIEPLEGINDFLSALPCPYFILSSQEMTDIKKKLLLTELQSFFTDNTIFSVPDNNYWSTIHRIINENNFKVQTGLLIKDRPQNIETILQSGLSLACPGDFIQDFDTSYHIFENIKELCNKYTFS